MARCYLAEVQCESETDSCLALPESMLNFPQFSGFSPARTGLIPGPNAALGIITKFHYIPPNFINEGLYKRGKKLPVGKAAVSLHKMEVTKARKRYVPKLTP